MTMHYFEDLDEVFIHDDQREKIAEIDQWLFSAANKVPGTPHVLYLTGVAGIGKSYLMKNVILELEWQLRDTQEQAGYIKISSDGFSYEKSGLADLFSHRASFGEHQADAAQRLYELTRPLILAIDEFGLEKYPVQDTFAEGICTMMDARDQLYTVCISNLGSSELKDRYEPRISTRILDVAQTVGLGGKPWRDRSILSETERVIAAQRATAEAARAAEGLLKREAERRRRELSDIDEETRNRKAQAFLDEWEKIKTNHGACCDLVAITALKLQLGRPLLPQNFKRGRTCRHGVKLASLLAASEARP